MFTRREVKDMEVRYSVQHDPILPPSMNLCYLFCGNHHLLGTWKVLVSTVSVVSEENSCEQHAACEMRMKNFVAVMNEQKLFFCVVQVNTERMAHIRSVLWKWQGVCGLGKTQLKKWHGMKWLWLDKGIHALQQMFDGYVLNLVIW